MGTRRKTGIPDDKLGTNARTSARPTRKQHEIWRTTLDVLIAARIRGAAQKQRTLYLGVLVGVESTMMWSRRQPHWSYMQCRYGRWR